MPVLDLNKVDELLGYNCKIKIEVLAWIIGIVVFSRKISNVFEV